MQRSLLARKPFPNLQRSCFDQKLTQTFKTLTEERVAEFVGNLKTMAVSVAEFTTQYSFERDPKDEPYINLALSANATHLVSRDKDLLDLMDTNTELGKDFCDRFPGLAIVNPVAFLQIMENVE